MRASAWRDLPSFFSNCRKQKARRSSRSSGNWWTDWPWRRERDWADGAGSTLRRFARRMGVISREEKWRLCHSRLGLDVVRFYIASSTRETNDINSNLQGKCDV